MLTLEQRLKMLECPTGPVDVVLDTDTYNEIDDQYAIAYALAAEKIHLQAIYAAPFFNSHSTSPADGMEKSYQEILTLLKLSGKEKLVFRGSDRYLPSEKEPVPSPAVDDLVSRAMQYSPEKPLYVVAIGAITNIASAILTRPEIADQMVVVWLGGNSMEWHDNMEFNAKQDVAAARVVFGSGVPLVILPCMGMVSSFTTTGPELEYWLRGKNSLCDYLIDATINEANAYAKGKVWSRPIWDVTAVGWLLNDKCNLMLDKLIHTPISEYDHHWSTDPRRPLCRYVYFIRRDALMAELFEHCIRCGNE